MNSLRHGAQAALEVVDAAGEGAVGKPVFDLAAGSADAAGVEVDGAGDLQVLELVDDRRGRDAQDFGEFHRAPPLAVQ